MGLASQKEIDKAVRQAKKDLTTEQIKDALKQCSYGGKAIGMELKRPFDCMEISMKGDEIINGKTNT